MINLEKELQKRTAAGKKEAESFEGVKEVKLLLQATDKREAELLRSFKLDDAVAQVEANRGKSIQLETITAEFGDSYLLEDIKQLAVDYNLKFLPLELYNGGIDSQLASKMLEFCDKHNLDERTIAHSNSFYVLAPIEDFKLTSHKHKPRPVVTRDPLLFYKSDRTEVVWTFVHKWGSEFTPLRLLRAMKYVSNGWYVASKFLLAFAVLSVCLPVLGVFLTTGFVATVLLNAALSLLFAVGCWAIRENGENDNFTNYFTANTYRSSKNRRHEVG